VAASELAAGDRRHTRAQGSRLAIGLHDAASRQRQTPDSPAREKDGKPLDRDGLAKETCSSAQTAGGFRFCSETAHLKPLRTLCRGRALRIPRLFGHGRGVARTRDPLLVSTLRHWRGVPWADVGRRLVRESRTWLVVARAALTWLQLLLRCHPRAALRAGTTPVTR
jgi:hypothetical protein